MHDPRPPLWSGLSDEEHEFQYNPQRAFPNFADHQAERAPANTSARTNLKSHLDVPYGEHPLRRVDVFPADGAARTPVHVFFHGGYWRAQDKENFTFVARELSLMHSPNRFLLIPGPRFESLHTHQNWLELSIKWAIVFQTLKHLSILCQL